MDFLMLLDATDPLGNFSGIVNEVLEWSQKIGPAIGIIAIVVCFIICCFGDAKGNAERRRKIIGIIIGIIVISNIGYVVGAGKFVFNKIVGNDSGNANGIQSEVFEIETTP